jgi:hypothetical protein
MVFTILLLLGMMNSSVAMEAIGIPANSENNPFFSVVPSAPCGQCMNTEQILDVLKSKDVISKDFKCERPDNLQESFVKNIDAKSIANERAKIVKIHRSLRVLDGVKTSNLLQEEIMKIYTDHLSKCDPSVEAFVNDCLSECIKPKYQSVLEVKPWKTSENLNNAFWLMGRYDRDDLVGLVVGVVIFSFIIPARFFAFDRYLIPSYCLHKGLFAHTDSKQCKCHDKPNETFRCAYRLIHLGIGLLFFLYSFRNMVPRFFDFFFHLY